MPSIIIPCKKCGQKNRVLVNKLHLTVKCGNCGATITDTGPVELHDGNFTDFIRKSDRPVMIDFYSPNCGPCRMLAPVIDSLAGQFLGEVILAKLDTSRNAVAANQFGIRAVPTLVFLKNGREVERLTGAKSEKVIADRLRGLR